MLKNIVFFLALVFIHSAALAEIFILDEKRQSGLYDAIQKGDLQNDLDDCTHYFRNENRDLQQGMITPHEISNLSIIVTVLGGFPVDPRRYKQTLKGLQVYMNDVGIHAFSALELVTPHNSKMAQKCYPNVKNEEISSEILFLPPRCRWLNGAALFLIAQRVRDHIMKVTKTSIEPLKITNWWRPKCYNQKVGGSAVSDHRFARAIDIDFVNEKYRAIAQEYLCQVFWKNNPISANEPLNFSIGLGGKIIHIGLESYTSRQYEKMIYKPIGRGWWIYGAYRSYPQINTCSFRTPIPSDENFMETISSSDETLQEDNSNLNSDEQITTDSENEVH